MYVYVCGVWVYANPPGFKRKEGYKLIGEETPW